MEIFGILLAGEEISLGTGKNAALYEAYHQKAEVGETVDRMLKQLNLKLYDYNYGLYLTAGEQNRVFGYSNEELKRLMGLRLNKELYLCYYIIYCVMLHFYNDSATYTFAEYARIEDIVKAVDLSLANLIGRMEVLDKSEQEEKSFRLLALTWDELPMASNDEGSLRAGRNSRAGYVKLAFHFLISQGLLIESGERYYPTDRFHGMVKCYFEDERGRLYEIQQSFAAGVGRIDGIKGTEGIKASEIVGRKESEKSEGE